MTPPTQFSSAILLFVYLICPTLRSEARDLRSEATTPATLSLISPDEIAAGASRKPVGRMVTPEMFGASGDGSEHKLSEKFQTLAAARQVYPNVPDLNITLDGAAFQKAVDTAASDGGGVLAEGKYVINSPIIMKDNVIVDGNNRGILINNRTRGQMLNWAFLFGDHAPYGFNKEENNGSGYDFYDVNEPMKIGRSSLTLSNPSDAALFKPDQIVMIVSAYKRKQNILKVMLPYHITMARIAGIDRNTLQFEYPFDENVDEVQICANGNFDKHTGINFGGVQNVILRNLTIDAAQISGSEYAYKCHIDNIRLIDGVRLVGMNAMAYSSFTNISGDFSWRCMEIKTGTHNLIVRNIHGTYKAIPGFPQAVDAISIGQYNRNVTVDGFDIDFRAATPKIATVNFHSRKAVVANGTIRCPNQSSSFAKFHNEHYVDDPAFGCYDNSLLNVKFHGGPRMKTVFELGDGPGLNKGKLKDNWVTQKKLAKRKGKAGGSPGDIDMNEVFDAPQTADVPPESNTIRGCLFDGGSTHSVANFRGGTGNIIQDCRFSNAHSKASAAFMGANSMQKNSFRSSKR